MKCSSCLLAAPDVVVKTINENWEFILLACDGIWDVLSNEEVLKFVRTRVAQQMTPEMVPNDFFIFLRKRSHVLLSLSETCHSQ